MINLESSQEINTTDKEGNLWKIKLSKIDSTTNRWQLSFFFNDREFSLSKPQNNQIAKTFWELIQKTKVTPKINNKIDDESEIEEEITESKYKERPKKRAIKR